MYFFRLEAFLNLQSPSPKLQRKYTVGAYQILVVKNDKQLFPPLTHVTIWNHLLCNFSARNVVYISYSHDIKRKAILEVESIFQ